MGCFKIFFFCASCEPSAQPRREHTSFACIVKASDLDEEKPKKGARHYDVPLLSNIVHRLQAGARPRCGIEKNECLVNRYFSMNFLPFLM